jgi:membrane associated rhomboid family serine protease
MSQDDPDRPGPPSGSAGAAVPVCYRHADRETYIRCSRCDRSICPECMVSAAVGFHCPECVREAQKSVREPRTVLGGKVSAQAQTGQLTKLLIGINAVVFLLVMLVGNVLVERLILVGKVGFSGVVGGPIGVANGDWYRLLTAVFLHEQLFHVAANMLLLWFLGPQLEALLGRLRFLGLYLLCGLGGSAASYTFSLPIQPSLGASGAVFGLVGAMLVIGRKLNYDLRSLMVFLALNIVIGFLPGLNIDWRAHLGGLATGAVLGFAFAYAPQARRNMIHVAACLGVLLVIVVDVLARTAALNS